MDTQTEMNNVWTIASKEFRDNVKSKRFILIGILYMGMALLLMGITILSYHYYSSIAPAGVDMGFKPSQVLSMINMLTFILALLAVIVTADTISIEKKDRTIYQLLSKPVNRSSVVMGKFLGCLGIVSFLFVVSALVAYALTALMTGVYPAAGDIMAVLEAIVSMVILFAVYVAIGILISTITKNPLISIIGAIIVWVGLLFSSIMGKAIGSLTMTDASSLLATDPFTSYPIYAKALIWIDPSSHGIIDQLLSGGASQVVSGLPIWANVIVLLAYTVVLLLVSIELFNRQDL